MAKLTASALLIMLLFISQENRCHAFEFNGTKVTLSYPDKSLLYEFNTNLHMGRLMYLLRGKRPLTIESEVITKIEAITKRVEDILEMPQPDLSFTVRLCRDKTDIDKTFFALYRKKQLRPGFYSPSSNTLFISVQDTNLKVIAHEIGHVVVEHYFDVRPPEKIHELLSQFAEKHIDN